MEYCDDGIGWIRVAPERWASVIANVRALRDADPPPEALGAVLSRCLSAYEPCELCGTPVVPTRHGRDADVQVDEIVTLWERADGAWPSSDTAARSAFRRHRCPGRPTIPGAHPVRGGVGRGPRRAPPEER